MIQSVQGIRDRMARPDPWPLVPINPKGRGLSVQCAACHRMRPTGRCLAALSEPAGTYVCAGCLADAVRVLRDPRDLA